MDRGKNIKLLALLSIALFFAFACSKDDSTPLKTLESSDYFPVDTGTYWIYDVTKIEIDAPINRYDTNVFEIKMLVKQYDGDLKQYEFWRYSRVDSLSSWENYDIVTVSIDDYSVQWVEDNLRYLKMKNPIVENRNWDGNTYNIKEPWNYLYSDLDYTFENDYLNISNCIIIEQRNVVNLLQSEIAKEVYAKNIGLVYKYEEVLILEANLPKTGYINEFNLKLYKTR